MAATTAERRGGGRSGRRGASRAAGGVRHLAGRIILQRASDGAATRPLRVDLPADVERRLRAVCARTGRSLELLTGRLLEMLGSVENCEDPVTFNTRAQDALDALAGPDAQLSAPKIS